MKKRILCLVAGIFAMLAATVVFSGCDMLFPTWTIEFKNGLDYDVVEWGLMGYDDSTEVYSTKKTVVSGASDTLTGIPDGFRAIAYAKITDGTLSGTLYSTGSGQLYTEKPNGFMTVESDLTWTLFKESASSNVAPNFSVASKIE